jgi:hypothetical protein
MQLITVIRRPSRCARGPWEFPGSPFWTATKPDADTASPSPVTTSTPPLSGQDAIHPSSRFGSRLSERRFPFGRVAKETAGRLRGPQLVPTLVDGGGVRLIALYGPVTPTEPSFCGSATMTISAQVFRGYFGRGWDGTESTPQSANQSKDFGSTVGRRGVTPALGRRRRGWSTIGTHDRPIYHPQVRPTHLAFANRTAGRGPPRGLPHLTRRAMRPIAGFVSVDEWLLVASA